jgi:hypothetical protein
MRPFKALLIGDSMRLFVAKFKLRAIFRGESISFLVALLLLIYFFSRFQVFTDVPDFFYDADTPRTLAYLQDPRLAISSIRPGLFIIAIVANILVTYFPPFFIWKAINFLAIIVIGYAIAKFGGGTTSLSKIYLYLAVNFSILVWFNVPDTFLLGTAFFSAAILIYQDGKSYFRVILSGLVASSLNLFFLLPWILGHILIGRKKMRLCFTQSFLLFALVGTISVLTQFFQRFRPTLELSSQVVGQDKVRIQSYLPFYKSDGFTSKVEVLGWIHVPWMGAVENFICFISAPWMPSYKYQSGIWAINSSFFHFSYLLFSITLTFFAYLGFWRYRGLHQNSSLFILGLEISTFLLFFTYSTHPFLFSPFLVLTRVIGVALFAADRKNRHYLIVAFSVLASLLSLNLIN